MSYHNIDLEKSVIASLMSIDNSLQHVISKIDAEDFVAARHQTIFRGIKDLHTQGLPYDGVMLHDWLSANDLIKAVGGDSYLAEVLAQSPATLFNLTAYADRIAELAKYRAIDAQLVQAREALKAGEIRLDDKVNKVVEGLVSAIDTKKSGTGVKSVGELMTPFFDNIQAASRGESVPFVATGLNELDNRAPIQSGDLVVVGARPSMGKTTFGQTIVQNIVADSLYTDEHGKTKRKAGVFFSLEMTDDSVMQRFMSSMSSARLQAVRSGMDIQENEWAGMMQTASNYGNDSYPMFIESESLMTYHQMRTTLNKIRNKHGQIGVIMIDYLQIMGGIDGKDRVNALGEVTRHLKAFGKEFDCPVILLSQLNRSLENRPNKRPIMSDLRESGAIEQEADLIMFLYRDEVYNENTEHKGVAEVIVAKNRQGQVGTVRLAFEGQYSRFSNLIPQMGGYDDE